MSNYLKILMVYIFASICPPQLSATLTGPKARLTGIWAYADELTDSARLNYKQNNLRFFCDTEEGLPPDSLVYRFKLMGHDKDWVEAFQGGWYFYTDLPPGDYNFLAQCRLKSGDWGPTLAHEFSIVAPWWRTWQAYALYILAASAIALYIFYLIRAKIMMHNQLIVERRNQRFKTDFIIHAGREFRIPLTIILSTIEKMKDNMPNYRLTRTDIQHLRNSSRMLLQMVEQLVDFGEIKKDTPYSSKGDILEMADIPINKDTIVAIVEPNRQLADVIKRDILRFMKAETISGDRKEIVDSIMECKPDAVVLDTDLADANAYEVLSDIKKCADLRQTPVILIANFDNSRSLLRAIRSEADDYLPKPFNCEVLTALVIKKIRTSREASKNAEITTEHKPVRPLIDKRADKLFVDRLDRVIESNISNPDFDVNGLAADMDLSRGQVYNKIKELKGMTPVEYLREMRLTKAAALLKETSAPIKEIRSMVGLPDPTNFNRRFKERFKVSPSEYR